MYICIQNTVHSIIFINGFTFVEFLLFDLVFFTFQLAILFSFFPIICDHFLAFEEV